MVSEPVTEFAASDHYKVCIVWVSFEQLESRPCHSPGLSLGRAPVDDVNICFLGRLRRHRYRLDVDHQAIRGVDNCAWTALTTDQRQVNDVLVSQLRSRAESREPLPFISSEGVDRLSRIAKRDELAVIASQPKDQPLLMLSQVLKFVDEHVVVTKLDEVATVEVVAQKCRDVANQAGIVSREPLLNGLGKRRMRFMSSLMVTECLFHPRLRCVRRPKRWYRNAHVIEHRVSLMR